MSKNAAKILTGRCLCGGVSYRIEGVCRDIINCHCENCRRTHGHIAAYTSVDRAALELLEAQTLEWYHDRSPDTYRGFCKRCGASLFWDARDGRGKMAVAAGTLNHSAELRSIGHVYVSEAGSYYEIDDGLPRFEHGNDGELEGGGSG